MAVAATSASILSVAVVSAVFRPRRRIARQTGPDPDLEIITQQTARNRRILSQAVDLLSEPWGFGNKHFASILAQLRPSPFRGSWGKKARRRVEAIPTRAGCVIEIEFVEPFNLDLDTVYSSNIPTVIILHGINGHSTEAYCEQAALHIAVEKKWRACVLNYAKVKQTKEQALVGGQSLIDAGDISTVVSYIRKHHDGFLGALGFSMGGAKLVQYLCRTKEHSQLDAACCISSPLDFTERNCTVHRPVELVHRLYHFVVAASVKLSLAKNYFELRKHPRLANTTPFRRSRSALWWWLQTNTVTEIDRSITLPSKGYSDIHHYYNDATYIHQLRDSITMPFLCLTAKNDPFVPVDIIPTDDVAADNENIFIVNTPKVGGHIGFWLPGRGCWATRACLSFFDSVVSGTYTRISYFALHGNLAFTSCLSSLCSLDSRLRFLSRNTMSQRRRDPECIEEHQASRLLITWNDPVLWA